MRISDWSSDVCSSDLDLRVCSGEVEADIAARLDDLELQFVRPATSPIVKHRLLVGIGSIRDGPNLVSRALVRVVNQLREAGQHTVDAVLLEQPEDIACRGLDRKSTRLNSSHLCSFRMPSSAFKKK